MEEWKEYQLKDICLKITDGSHKSPKAQSSGYPMFSVKDMEEYGFNYNDCKLISSEDFAEMKSTGCVPEKDDILIAKDGSYLKQIFICKESREEAILSSIAIFRPDKNIIEPRFLLYLLKSPQVFNYIKTNCVSGSAIPRIVLKSFKDVYMRVPESLTEQKRISNFLEDIDNKIITNRRINENLEAQAQALFKSWFVDFEPFRDGEFVESELGMIPKGWKILSFKDFIIASNEKAPVDSLPEYSVTNSGIIPRDSKFNKKLSKSSSMNKVLRKNNLVFGMSRDILNWGIMEDEIGGVSSAYNVYIIDKTKVNPTYLRLFMVAKISYFHSLIGTAAREGQSLDKGQLMQKNIYLPKYNILQDFLSIYESINNKLSTIEQESRRLATLRDTLLPRLMSGELKVNEL